jgi:hypothetical protein
MRNTMTRRTSFAIASLILLALLALLAYSIDRTSWLLAQYELNQPGTLADYLGLSPLALGVAAALVIEVGAVALVGGDVLAEERTKIQRYTTAGLFVVLAVQALANLLAGYLRGYLSVRSTLEAHGADTDIAWWVAGISWVLSSAAVPALIFILSKLAAHVLRMAMSAPQTSAIEGSDPRSESAQERSETSTAPSLPHSAGDVLDAPRSAAQDQALPALSAPLAEERSSAQEPSGGSVIALDRYPCPHCQRALASGRAVGAAKTNGYCHYCKQERKRA